MYHSLCYQFNSVVIITHNDDVKNIDIKEKKSTLIFYSLVASAVSALRKQTAKYQHIPTDFKPSLHLCIYLHMISYSKVFDGSLLAVR